MLLRIIIFFSLLVSNSFGENLENCKWDYRKGVPCIVISKTPNTSSFSEGSVGKIIINREQIEKSGAIDVVDILKYVDVFKSSLTFSL